MCHLYKEEKLKFVCLLSSLGPGHLQVNSKSLKLKSPRDLDLELEAIIAMSPPPPANLSEWNNIEISSCMN